MADRERWRAALSWLLVNHQSVAKLLADYKKAAPLGSDASNLPLPPPYTEATSESRIAPRNLTATVARTTSQ